MEASALAELIEEVNRQGEHYFSGTRKTDAYTAKDQISSLINWFRAADTERRGEMAPRLTQSACKLLLGFSFQCAEQAVRQNDPSLIELGLSALILENGGDDWRHNIITMSVLYHSARRLKIDPDRAFAEVAEYGEHGMVRDEMARFPKRSAADRNIEAFGLQETTGPEGFAYEARR